MVEPSPSVAVNLEESKMKRFLAATLVLSLFSVCTLVGCSEETKQKDVSNIDGPNGSVKKTTEITTERTGDAKTGTNEPAK